MNKQVYVFKHSFHHYLVIAESELLAWDALQKRQSISMKNLKLQYKLLYVLSENQEIVKYETKSTRLFSCAVQLHINSIRLNIQCLMSF